MKKISLITLLVLFSKIATFGQGGIEVSVIPYDYQFTGFEKDKVFQFNNYGVKVGYFNWAFENYFGTYFIKMSRGSGEASALYSDPNSPLPVFQKYDIIGYTYSVGMAANLCSPEIDFKSHVHYGIGYSLIYRKFSTSLNSSKPIQDVSPSDLLNVVENIKYYETSSFDVAFSMPIGYQHNIKRKLGLYVQASPTIALPSISFFVEASLGARFRLGY